ncbi:helix-turn-helix domain-containing protein [Peribacillus frigoritolerans]|uniref:helix-turn-helix domain-containing protein n=1 Tax=Peribacillus frigoritolerans TaxID=450367 RepID=UPI001070CB84|nr:helix-turn-helix transcriptional regulator [Peribacillus frigoritolerans]TFH59641.1 XRE family transcriptional regulator [Peribacillus frigoritolerans]
MANEIRLLFGKMVRQKRLTMGISQEELAFSCGLHRTYISDIERGTRNVSLDNIEKIANALGISSKDLLDFTTIDNFQQKEKNGGENIEN